MKESIPSMGLASGSRQGQDFQSFRMRSFVFYSIGMEKVKKALQYFSRLPDDPVKGFRPAFAEAATRRQV